MEKGTIGKPSNVYDIKTGKPIEIKPKKIRKAI